MQVVNPATFDLKRFLAADTPNLDLGWSQFEKKINKYLEAVSLNNCFHQLTFSLTRAWPSRTRKLQNGHTNMTRLSRRSSRKRS